MPLSRATLPLFAAAMMESKVGLTMEHLPFTGRVQSFRYALTGIWTMLRREKNAQIHALATVAVIVLGLYLGLSATEWCWIVVATVSVWTAEALNTAIEFLCDVASPEFHPLVQQTKDVAAGAVLITALGAVLIGVFVLGPRLIALF